MAKKKNTKTRIIVISVVSLLVIIALILVFSTKGEKPINVQVSKVEKRSITQIVSAVGKIQPETEVKISSETSGEIIFLGVNEGDHVHAGQLVVRIKPDIVETMVEQYKAAADAAKMEIDGRKVEKDHTEADLKRITELLAKDYASKQDYDRAKATFDGAVSNYKASLSRYEQALASLKQIQKNMSRTTIASPIEGIVTKLSVEKGENVVGTAQMQGTEMMRISNLNVMNALVDVDENDIVNVKVGDTTRIEIDAFPNKSFVGTVYEIGHSAKVSALGSQDQQTNFEVKIRIIDSEGKLRPGMSCSVDIETETRHDVLAVPLQAVTVRDTKKNINPDLKASSIQLVENEDKKAKNKRPPSVVFIKQADKAIMQRVETGLSDNGFIEIRSGLTLGQEIISGGFDAVSKTLNDSSKIMVDTAAKKKKGL
ncbi:MAG: efflux RND transporter periplasmic adaptor subunit [Candidatus Kapabacteria bacterium]|nr:efflux RND transporter periplasmic adaptor subunit [Candidatus Kapabacteria bacterium]